MGNEKLVEQLQNGLIIEEYHSAKSAGRKMNVSDSAIRQSIRNGTKCKGYHWRYKQQHFENSSEIFHRHPTLPIHCSNSGRIKHKFGNIVEGSLHPSGYKYVMVEGKKYSVSRLIAETFIPNPERKLTVDHIDRNRINNRVENLRWFTMKEQAGNRNWVDHWNQ